MSTSGLGYHFINFSAFHSVTEVIQLSRNQRLWLNVHFVTQLQELFIFETVRLGVIYFLEELLPVIFAALSPTSSLVVFDIPFFFKSVHHELFGLMFHFILKVTVVKFILLAI